MSRIAVIRRVGRVERVACVLPGPIRSLGRRGTANPASDEELERALAVIGTLGKGIVRDSERPGAFFLDPSAGAALYGGLAEWARTVEGYLRGRGYFAAIVIGVDRATTYAHARSRPGVTVLASALESEHRAAHYARGNDARGNDASRTGRRQPLLPGIRDRRRSRAA